jgi:hypothetical protein
VRVWRPAFVALVGRVGGDAVARSLEMTAADRLVNLRAERKRTLHHKLMDVQ